MSALDRPPLGILGIGAVCAACCAGPELAFFGAVGLAGTALFGVAGAVVVGLALAGWIAVRRRRRARRMTNRGPVPVAAPTRRTPA
jgi:hypothetical protein